MGVRVTFPYTSQQPGAWKSQSDPLFPAQRDCGGTFPMRNLHWLAAVLLLSGCGGGREDKAVEACSAELANKLTGKTYVLDKADMRKKTTVDGDTLAIASQVVFDPGLPAEAK